MVGMLVATLSVVAALELYPAPQSAYMQERNFFTIESTLPIIIPDNVAERDLTFLEPLYNALGYEPTLIPASRFDLGNRAFYIGTLSGNAAFRHRSLRRYAPDPQQARPETYYLTINRSGIFLAGSDHAGLVRGVYTLAQIVRAGMDAGRSQRGIPAVPYVEIRDYPDMRIRAACISGPITSLQIQAFAALKCNMLIFESDDFYDLRGERRTLWQSVFNELRTAGIIPVPVFQVLQVPAVFLQKNPAAVEGRSRIDKLTLYDDDWSAFTRRHLIVTAENPVQVTMNDKPMRLREDYLLNEGGLEPPFSNLFVHPWMARRVPGGAIAHGAAVTVTYSYAPPHSNALCPYAPETRTLIYDALRQLIESLEPAYIHGGFGDITRLNQDLRCRAKNNTHAEVFAAAVTLLYDLAADIKSDIRMIIWADALLPLSPYSQEHDATSLQDAMRHLPAEIMLVPRIDANACVPGGRLDAMLQWMANRNMPLFSAVTADTPAAAYRVFRQIEEMNATTKGMVLMGANPLDPVTRALLGKAWSADSQRLFWPEGLNDFFGSALWSPDFSEVKNAQVQFLESRVLAGEHPKELREQFDRFLNDRRGILPKDAADIRAAVALFEQLTRYLELEYEYARGNERDALRGVERLLRGYGEADREIDKTRIDRISETVQKQLLFPPASILTGRPMAYYRPVALPTGIKAYHAPAQITYVDEKGAAEATLDFLADCGGIFRVDFETVNAVGIALLSSDDGVNFAPVPVSQNTLLVPKLNLGTRREPPQQGRSFSSIAPARSQQTALNEGVARAPLFPATPLRNRYLRVRVESKGEQAVLREVRAFVAKTATRATVPMIAGTSPAQMDWPAAPRVSGFLDAAGMSLAVAPTEIRLARDREHLFIGVMAQEPMPHAMGASMTGRDAPLWQEESVEVRIRPGDRPARRFLVNPLGAQHDGMAVAGNLDQWDDGWDGDWHVQAEKTATGWTATIMLSFATLGAAPGAGDAWHVNFIRHRNNVEKETSLWAVAPDNAGSHYGVMAFE